MRLRTKFLLPLMTIVAIHLRADDGAASIAAGGIVVMKREARVTMAKEVLQISPSKVIVDYDFRNDSNEDITTEVAFPIPDYDNDLDRNRDSVPAFDDFLLWVDGAPARYQVEARAFLKDTEYTQLLTSMRVEVASFGHGPLLGDVIDGRGHRRILAESQDIQRLTAGQRKQLEELGLLDEESGDEPQWRVKKKYYWQQTFPAHKVVHISHEYSPVRGSENSVGYGLGSNPDKYAAEEIKSFCLDGPLHTTLQRIADGQDKDKTASYNYVDFILTTANTWTTPIKDFTLIVERPHWKNNRGENDLGDYVSFCWDGPVTKIDADHFSAHTVNLIPAKELRIGFFSVERRH
jgi:hypothetical protein